MKLSEKTIQSYINTFIELNYDWSEIEYRNGIWELTSEQFPEDNTANFYFTNGNTEFFIGTDANFSDGVLVSAVVNDVINLEETA